MISRPLVLLMTLVVAISGTALSTAEGDTSPFNRPTDDSSGTRLSGPSSAATIAANAMTGSISLRVVIDNTPPVITPTVSPTPSAYGWNNTDAVVTWNVVALSGVAVSSGCGLATLTAETAATTLTCSATSGAGLSAANSVTIKIDKTPPIVTYSGNAGSYTVDQTVAIKCMATDPLSNGVASGIAATSCQDIMAPAYSFPLGTNTVAAWAIDKADNLGSGSTGFTVLVTAGSLCVLTVQFVQSSPSFQQLPPWIQAWATALAGAVCGLLAAATSSPDPEDKAEAIAAYQWLVAVLVPLGWLTQEQATILIRLSNGL